MSKVSEARYELMPLHPSLPLDRLSGIFHNTSASYKFYWFLSILDLINESSTVITFKELNIRMIALSWHTINYHKLSFGTQDKLAISIKNIIQKSEGEINENEDKDKLIKYLNSNYDKYKQEINHFNKKVPYHFLSPFLGTCKNNQEWIEKSNASFEQRKPCVYRLFKGAIEIHPEWKRYFQIHQKFLIDFILWNFSYKYLQKYNPNVPNISGKLIHLSNRKNLSKQSKLWKIYAESVPLISIYSRKKIFDYDLDHFVPWSFVSHDQIWNLAPIEKSLNSSKSNKLPNSKLVKGFCEQQYSLLQVLNRKKQVKEFKNTIEDYSNIFHAQTTEILEMEEYKFVSTLKHHIDPLIQFASNMGFQKWEHNQ